MLAPKKNFVGLENYVEILTDAKTYKVLMNTFLYIAILLVLNLVVPYIFAFVLHLIVRKFKNLFKTAFFLPSFISLVVGSILATFILNPVSGPVAILAKLYWFIHTQLDSNTGSSNRWNQFNHDMEGIWI